MSEQKKKRFLVIAVTGRTLKEVARKLEDEKNRLVEEGYGIQHIEEKHVPKQFGYVIHAALQAMEQQPSPMIALPFPPPGVQRSDEWSDKAKSFLKTIFEKAQPGTPAAVLEKGPELIPSIVQGMPVSEINELAEEIEEKRKSHEEHHPDPNCEMLKVYVMLGEKLREQAKHHLQ